MRDILIRNRYLHLPVRNGAPARRMELRRGGKAVRAFDIELAEDEADFRVFADVSAFSGQTLTVHVDRLPAESQALNAITQDDRVPDADALYNEPLRPQFHVSQRRGWNNDPNGMVYCDGEWHLFFQHNPYGWKWANMHWGHVVSRDLVHWEELPDALHPWTQAKAHCFSGSAVVDADNTAGFRTGSAPVIVAAFTDTGCGEALAYSNDRGRTFTYYTENPVIEHRGRDPKVIWYAPGSHWVMAVYDEEGEGDDRQRRIAFYTSTDLRNWQLESRLDGYYECPEIFELPVDGDPGNTRWVVYAADARYAIGRFDGKVFIPEHDGKHQLHWGHYYASQTFSNAPDGRRIQMGWGRIDMPGMPFNQMMTFPCDLTLRTTERGLRMLAWPVAEIEQLYTRTHEVSGGPVGAGQAVSVPVDTHLLDIRAEFAVGSAEVVGLEVGGRRITYDAARRELEAMPLLPREGRVHLRILVDRSSIEVFGNEGRVCLTSPFRAGEGFAAVSAFAEGGKGALVHLRVSELASIWR